MPRALCTCTTKSCLLCIDGVFVSSHTLVRSTIEVDALLPGWCRVSKGTEQGLYLFLTGLQKKYNSLLHSRNILLPECLSYSCISVCNVLLTTCKSDIAKMLASSPGSPPTRGKVNFFARGRGAWGRGYKNVTNAC